MPPQTSMAGRFNGIALSLVSITAVLILISMGAPHPRFPRSPILLVHPAVPTLTNAHSVCITLTNLSTSTVSYLACPLQMRSNGIWSGPTLPTRQTLTRLPPRQSGVVVVDAAFTNGNARVPVLWGYDYDTRASMWPRLHELAEDLAGRIRGRGGRGLLYTNYMTNISL